MSNDPSPSRRVLSIQSHVVSGYVGNKAATFPLQLFGFDVDPINTVHLSNHTGYKNHTGSRLNAEGLLDLFTGLQRNSLDDWTHVLTGYVGSAAGLTAIAQLVQSLRTKGLPPYSVLFVCDPVMGDGSMYVPYDVLPVYRDILIPLSDIVTPNQFEAESLTGLKIATIEDAKRVAHRLHEMGPKMVVITSMTVESTSGFSVPNENTLVLLGSTRQGNTDDTKTEIWDDLFTIAIPKLDGYFSGTGDLFCALLIGHLDRDLGNSTDEQRSSKLSRSCEKVVATMRCVLERTMYEKQRLLRKEKGLCKERLPARDPMRYGELLIVRCKDVIEDPPIPNEDEPSVDQIPIYGRARFLS